MAIVPRGRADCPVRCKYREPEGCAEYSACTKTPSTWRSILIGSMGIGGASAKTCSEGTNCVQSPITDPADAEKGFGNSSYFALDVTIPGTPKLLWEFSNLLSATPLPGRP